MERKIINKAMKEFRPTKKFAKENGVELNAIFYTGEQLTKSQVDAVKQMIYSMTELNSAVGKELGDIIVKMAIDTAIKM